MSKHPRCPRCREPLTEAPKGDKRIQCSHCGQRIKRKRSANQSPSDLAPSIFEMSAEDFESAFLNESAPSNTDQELVVNKRKRKSGYTSSDRHDDSVPDEDMLPPSKSGRSDENPGSRTSEQANPRSTFDSDNFETPALEPESNIDPAVTPPPLPTSPPSKKERNPKRSRFREDDRIIEAEVVAEMGPPPLPDTEWEEKPKQQRGFLTVGILAAAVILFLLLGGALSFVAYQAVNRMARKSGDVKVVDIGVPGDENQEEIAELGPEIQFEDEAPRVGGPADVVSDPFAEEAEVVDRRIEDQKNDRREDPWAELDEKDVVEKDVGGDRHRDVFQNDPKRMVAGTKKATALVITPQGTGSAFCIHRDGVFATNAHVVRSLKQGDLVKIVTNSGEANEKEHLARLAMFNAADDLAILVNIKDEAFDTVEMGAGNELIETDEIIAFGFPFGKALVLRGGQFPAISINKGNVTALRRDAGGQLRLIQIDAQVNPGNSGGPIVDVKGNVVGIVKSGVKNSGVHFAIPVEKLSKMLEKPICHVATPTRISPELVESNRPIELQVKALFIPPGQEVRIEIKGSQGIIHSEMTRDEKFEVLPDQISIEDKYLRFEVVLTYLDKADASVQTTSVFPISVPVTRDRAEVAANLGNDKMDDAPGLDAGINVPKMEKPNVVNLPATVGDVCVGANGRYVFALMPAVKKIAVIDFEKSNVVKILSVVHARVLMTAGRDCLLIVDPEKNMVQRFELESFRKTRGKRLNLDEPITSVTLGSNSNGPALVTTTERTRPIAFFLDTKTLMPINVPVDIPRTAIFRLDPNGVRTNANGNVFVLADSSSVAVLKIANGRVDFFSDRMALSPYVSLSPLGDLLHVRDGSVDPEVNNGSIRQEVGFGREGIFRVPGLHPGIYARVKTERIGLDSKTVITLFMEGSKKPIARLVGDDAFLGIETMRRLQRMSLEKRILISKTEQKVAFVLGSEIRTYQLNFEQLLKKSVQEFLVVTSNPIASAKSGRQYQYSVKAITNGKVSGFSLVESPEGMTIDEQGVISWSPTRNQARQTHRVVVAISNESNRQVLHSFEINVDP